MVFPRPALESVRTLMAVGSSLAFVGEHQHHEQISAEKRCAHITVVVRGLNFWGKLLYIIIIHVRLLVVKELGPKPVTGRISTGYECVISFIIASLSSHNE
jgi:hypothetical protein